MSNHKMISKNKTNKNEDELTVEVREIRKSNPSNMICADCPKRATTNVCMDFAIFVCTECASIHQKFNHRIKSISLSTFSVDDVKKLRNGGNEVCKTHYMAKYKRRDPFTLPKEGELSKIEDFIRFKYVEKKWYSDSDNHSAETKANHKHKDPTLDLDSDFQKENYNPNENNDEDSENENSSSGKNKKDGEVIKRNRSTKIETKENKHKQVGMQVVEADLLGLPISQPTNTTNKTQVNDDWTSFDSPTQNWDPFSQLPNSDSKEKDQKTQLNVRSEWSRSQNNFFEVPHDQDRKNLNVFGQQSQQLQTSNSNSTRTSSIDIFSDLNNLNNQSHSQTQSPSTNSSSTFGTSTSTSTTSTQQKNPYHQSMFMQHPMYSNQPTNPTMNTFGYGMQSTSTTMIHPQTQKTPFTQSNYPSNTQYVNQKTSTRISDDIPFNPFRD